MRPGDGKGIQHWQIGLIAIVAVVVGFYLAFAKSLPFSGDGYTVKAVYGTEVSLRYDADGRSGIINQSAAIKASWRF